MNRLQQAAADFNHIAANRRNKNLTETFDDYFLEGVQWADAHPRYTHMTINSNNSNPSNNMEKSLKSRSKELALQICDICDGLSAQEALIVLANATTAFLYSVASNTEADDDDLIMPYLLSFFKNVAKLKEANSSNL